MCYQKSAAGGVLSIKKNCWCSTVVLVYDFICNFSLINCRRTLKLHKKTNRRSERTRDDALWPSGRHHFSWRFLMLPTFSVCT